ESASAPAAQPVPKRRSKPTSSTSEPKPEASSPAPSDAPAAGQPAAASVPVETPASAGGMSLVDVRRLWPQVLDAFMKRRRFAWVMLSQNANVHALQGETLTIAMVSAGARDSFVRNGCDQILHDALVEVIGVRWKIETIVDPSTDPSASAASPASSDPDPPPAAAAPSGSPPSEAVSQA